MVDEALTKLNLNEEFEMVGDLAQMVEEGVTEVPALKVNGKVMVEGRLPEVDEVMNILKEELA
ncbi:thioredoxin family protein [Anaeromicrobium sediminis]|uniref:thioredoxin family protein n=1 Tax=Anaeromicrobium sediminis TaxID=1478221 RepID=UPI00241ED251|nr:thioredoxin family protein [Anaeromicrobium sediminis]